MAFEIERKFLVKNGNWRNSVIDALDFKQGYLSIEPVIRVRISNDIQAFLTIKGPRKGITTPEFEYQIPVSDGLCLFSLCKHTLEKTRFIVNRNGLRWEIDEFKGRHSGLILAEIEIPTEHYKFDAPDFIGKEVTADIKYTNAWLALH